MVAQRNPYDRQSAGAKSTVLIPTPFELGQRQAMTLLSLGARHPGAHAHWRTGHPRERCWMPLPAGKHAPARHPLSPALEAAASAAWPAGDEESIEFSGLTWFKFPSAQLPTVQSTC